MLSVTEGNGSHRSPQRKADCNVRRFTACKKFNKKASSRLPAFFTISGSLLWSSKALISTHSISVRSLNPSSIDSDCGIGDELGTRSQQICKLMADILSGCRSRYTIFSKVSTDARIQVYSLPRRFSKIASRMPSSNSFAFSSSTGAVRLTLVPCRVKGVSTGPGQRQLQRTLFLAINIRKRV
jgi:hypothetical protein